MIPTLTVSIDRTDLALAPLVMGADMFAELAIVSYTEPSIVQRTRFAPTSAFQHGDMPLGSTLDNTTLQLTVGPQDAATEQDAQDAIDELVVALSRLTYEVTVTTNGATPQVWTCYPGGLVPAGPRTFQNLRAHRPIWQITIPAHPIPD